MSDVMELEVTPAQRLLTEACSVKVNHAPPGAQVTIEATLTDRGGQAWTSRAVYYPDHRGTVDTARAASIGGTYHGVDAEALFWSMQPATPDELVSEGSGIAPVNSPRRFADFDDVLKGHSLESFRLRRDPVDISVTARLSGVDESTGQMASATQLVHIIAPGVRRIEGSEGDLCGTIYEAPGEGPHPIAMVVTGSVGGANEMKACQLASSGITAFALAHFGHPGRPASLIDMPLEYFRDAIDWFAARYGERRVALMGDSRGGEAVLLIASHFPDRVSALVPGVPSNMVFAGFDIETMGSGPAWLLSGEPLSYVNWSFLDTRDSEIWKGSKEARDIYRHDMTAHDLDDGRTIPVEKIDCPILLISGEADATWPGNIACERVLERLTAKGFSHPVEHVEYKGAGHLVTYPMLIKSRGEFTEVNDFGFALGIGGNPADNARAQTEAFCRTVAFVKAHYLARD